MSNLKNQEKIMFVIPGLGQSQKDKYFDWLVKLLKTKGFVVKVVPIKWNRRTMPDYINDFKLFFKKNKTKNNYFFGFSYGSVIAFSVAIELKPKKMYLCSLSPDFKEDVVKMKPWIQKIVGKKRLLDIKNRSGRDIAKKLKIPTVLFYGEAEGKKFPNLKIRAEETAKLSKKVKLVVVKDAPHDISHPEYRKAIISQLK